MSRRRHLSLKHASNTSSIFEPLESRQMFSAGALDPSFSGDGIAAISFGSGINVNAKATTVQADGKTVVVGFSSDHRFAVARFNLDGTPDTTFGPSHNGTVLTHAGPSDYMNFAHAVMIDQDGKIIVGGYSFHSIGAGLPYDGFGTVARYLPNGALDTSFAKNSKTPGVLITDFDGLNYCDVSALATGPNGKILVGGEAYPDTFTGLNEDMVVARLNSDGSFDGSFGDSGRRFIGFGQSEEGDAMTVDNSGTPQSNPHWGSIIIVGRQAQYDGFNGEWRMAVARLTPGGNFDNSFDGDGRKTFTFPNESRAIATGVLVQSDSRIVISGTVAATYDNKNHSLNQDFALMRLLANGSVDTSFGNNGSGIVVTNISGEDIAGGMIRAFDGSLLVGGQAGGKVAVAKYTADGVLDGSFGQGGVVVGETGGFSGLAVGPGRRFVATGGASFHTDRFLDTDANLVWATTLFGPTATTEATPAQPLTFMVIRSERLPVATRVYLTVGGTATSPLSLLRRGADYTGIQAPPIVLIGNPVLGVASPQAILGGNTCYVDILPNETYATITITPVDDKVLEGDETAIFTVAANAAYDLGTPNSLTLTIHDNDGVTLKDTADAYVRDGLSANTNFGSATDIEVKKNTTGVNRVSYIKFDLTSIAASNIGTVSLRLFGSLNNTNQQNVATSVFGASNTTWSENAITFNNKPATTTGPLASTTIVNNTPQWYTWDITAYVKAELAAGHKTITLVLQNSGTSDPFATFASKEAGGNAPQLAVAYA